MILNLFGTDGIRGKGFTELTAKLAFNLGNSLKEALNNKIVVIGQDTRKSSTMLAHMVAAGALLAGLDVYYAGIVSTPMISHYSKVKEITGIMITASHNPFEDNGIKVFNKGIKSTKEEEKVIEKYINEDILYKNEIYGSFNLTEDVENEYFKIIDKLNLKSSNLKIAYDSANGANYKIANKVFNKYFNNSIQINNEPNGENINFNCGSTHLNSIIEFIKKNNMDLGFAYDGDGDRVIMIGNNGEIYDGDFIILLVAKYLKNNNLLTNNGVVVTKMTNPGILKALRNNDINYVITDVGDKYVYAAMEEHGYIVGGEASGHVIINQLLHTGDGLFASLYILKLLEEENIKLEDITKEVDLYPFKMVNIKNINKEVLKEIEVKEFLDNLSKDVDELDIFNIRPSGTEPLIRVTISCKDEDKLNNYMNKVVLFIKERGEIK